jgi:hypothetical protein
MRNISRALIVALGCAVIAGCTGTDMYTGKGDDHQVSYRLGATRDNDRDTRVVYATPQPRVVYVQPAQPAYVYDPMTPRYQVVPVVRTVPVTRYYYYDYD